MLLALVALAAPILAADKALVAGMDSTESRVRARAAYALARTHTPDDAAAWSLLDRTLRTAPTTERTEIVRGLACRSWPSEMPARVSARLVGLLADGDALVRRAVLDGTRCLPRGKAAEILLAEEKVVEKRPEGTASRQRAYILKLGVEMGLPEMRPLVEKDVHSRSGFQLFKKDCTWETCEDDIVALAALGEDVGWITGRSAALRLDPTFVEQLNILRVQAIAGDSSAVSALERTATRAVDVEIRRRVLAWLTTMPPAPRADAVAAVASWLHDPDTRLRWRAAAFLASAPRRHPSVAGSLVPLLDDGDLDVRLEAAVALHDLGRDTSAAVRSCIEPK